MIYKVQVCDQDLNDFQSWTDDTFAWAAVQDHNGFRVEHIIRSFWQLSLE